MTKKEFFASGVEQAFKNELANLSWKEQSKIIDYANRKNVRTKEDMEEFLYKHLEGKDLTTFEEIGKALNISTSLARNTYVRAMDKLKELCEGNDELRLYIK